MSVWGFVANAATGGAYGLLEAGIDAATGSSSPTTAPSDTATGSTGGSLDDLVDKMRKAQADRDQANKPPANSAPQTTACCDRYRFNDGFLIDGVTGLVWRFDESQKAFVEVLRKPAKEKLPLFKTLFDAKIQELRNQYETQLVTLSPELRTEATKEFEKRFVQPLRDSTGVGP